MADREYYHEAVVTDGLLRGLTELRDEKVIWMPKDKPATSSSNVERKPWKNKPYMLRLIGSEEKPNKFYRDEPYVDERTGKQKPADDPIEKTQYNLKFEVVKGDKTSDWIWTYAGHWFSVDSNGNPRGKRAVIAKAIDPDFNLEDGIEDDHSDLIGGVCMGLVEPTDKEGKYGKVTKFYPVEEGETIPGPVGDALEKAKDKAAPVTAEVELDEDGCIPF